MSSPRRVFLPLLLVLILLAALAFDAAGPAPALAQSQGSITEDGRVIPLPVQAGEEVSLSANIEAAPAGPGVLAKRQEQVDPEAFGRLLEEAGYSEVTGLLVPQWWRVGVPEEQTVDEVIARLQAIPEVEAVEEDRIVELAYTPNDPSYGSQWGLPKVQAPAAWNLTRGSSDVLIAVVDTGIDYTHGDRPANLWVGWDFINNDNDPYDDHSHGTHVAGIVAADTNNSTGIAGMCPSCSVVAIKVLGANGSGSHSAIAGGIRQAADAGVSLDKRVIINLSLGGLYSTILEDAIGYAMGKGDLIVAAAGNDGPGSASYPAAFTGVLGVSATTSGDAPASYSQYGILAAPGSSILSTVPGGYGYKSGTSMASPCVAGAAGLLWSRAPGLTPAQIITALRNQADVPSGWDTDFGSGRLNVYRALLAAAPTPTPSPTPTRTPTPFPTPLGGWPNHAYLPLIIRD
ncbi:MAG: S8 family peptidase [Anaerolineae bacterium]